VDKRIRGLLHGASRQGRSGERFGNGWLVKGRWAAAVRPAWAGRATSFDANQRLVHYVESARRVKTWTSKPTRDRNLPTTAPGVDFSLGAIPDDEALALAGAPHLRFD
jgi:hypothetical protein